MTKILPIGQVKVGMVIIKVTEQNGPAKIKKSGLVSSEDMISALCEMGVQSVEVDPDMTVEVKKPKITKSKTQQLLEDSGAFTQAVDEGITEQFNRSLFLPSVQELPDAWQYYGKKSAVVGLVLCMGLVCGWSVAWLSSLPQLPTLTLVSSSPAEAQTHINKASTEQPSESQDNATDEDTQNTSLSNNTPEAPVSTANTESTGVNRNDNPLPSNTPVDVPEPPQELVLNGPATTDPDVNIPPELLQRFRDAMTAIGDEPSDGPAVEVQPIKDVPPVQELPAWILTRLPSIAFSAHLYASDPNDRWVRVNGRRVTEGQTIEDDLRLVSIEPQHVILTFQGQEFSMEALSDW